MIYRDDDSDDADKIMVNFCLFAYRNPVTFEDEAKNRGWLKAMWTRRWLLLRRMTHGR